MTSPELELIEAMDRGWTSFRDAVGRNGDLGRVTTSGWTVREMLGHVAAWHDATAYRLHRFAATGVAQPKVEPDDDAFNARVASESADLPDGRVIAALDGSFSRLRAALHELPEGYAHGDDGWVAAVVAGNTYEHYAEHLPELTAASSP